MIGRTNSVIKDDGGDTKPRVIYSNLGMNSYAAQIQRQLLNKKEVVSLVYNYGSTFSSAIPTVTSTSATVTVLYDTGTSVPPRTILFLVEGDVGDDYYITPGDNGNGRCGMCVISNEVERIDSFYPTVTATTKTLSKKRVFVHLHQLTNSANTASITSASANVKILSDVVFNNSKNLVVEVTGNIGDEFVINTSLTNGSYCGVAILG